jgi:hypothetical protein
MSMTCRLFSEWHDIHAAHTDPFRGGAVHGHLWRVRFGVRQALGNRTDVRQLNAQAMAFALQYDHRDIGLMSTEDIALAGQEYARVDFVEVEEVGVCAVMLEAEQ